MITLLLFIIAIFRNNKVSPHESEQIFGNIFITTKNNTMSFISDFKALVIKGNVMDLAVVVGAAFGAIVSSLVDDIITPLLLTPALKAVGA